jgi:hypothetical protein
MPIPLAGWALGAAAVYGVGWALGFWGKKSAWETATDVVNPKTGKVVKGYTKPKNPDLTTTHLDGTPMSEEEKGEALAQAISDDMDGYDVGRLTAVADRELHSKYASEPPSGHSKAWYEGWRRGYTNRLTAYCSAIGNCATVDGDTGEIDWPGVD